MVRKGHVARMGNWLMRRPEGRRGREWALQNCDGSMETGSTRCTSHTYERFGVAKACIDRWPVYSLHKNCPSQQIDKAFVVSVKVQMPLPGAFAGTLLLNYSVTNVVPTQKEESSSS
jgi:hypothetical protein